jgi:hypothetical protein
MDLSQVKLEARSHQPLSSDFFSGQNSEGLQPPQPQQSFTLWVTEAKEKKFIGSFHRCCSLIGLHSYQEKNQNRQRCLLFDPSNQTDKFLNTTVNSSHSVR